MNYWYVLFLVVILITFSTYNTYIEQKNSENFTSKIKQFIRPKHRYLMRNFKHHMKNVVHHSKKALRRIGAI